jgi:hypothetical protein
MNGITEKSNRRLMSRRGAASLICTMTAAVVFLGIAGVAVRSSLRARQERKVERDLLQLEFLCDAGVMRAQEQIAKSADYVGETWLDSDSLHSHGHWKVRITLADVPLSTENNTERTLTVIAEISDRHNSPETITRSRQIPVPRT